MISECFKTYCMITERVTMALYGEVSNWGHGQDRAKLVLTDCRQCLDVLHITSRWFDFLGYV